MKTLHYLILSILFLSSCDKFDWHNPYDPECPKELFTPSSPGATMEGNSVKLTWSQQNDDISGFALFRSAEGESIANLTQTQKSTTQYIDANVIPGKKYTYYVVAVAGTNKSDTVKAEIIPVIPVTISTGAVTELAASSAKVSGNITNAGGGTVTSRGICWATTPNPTVNNNKTTEGTGAGQFTSTLSNLLAGTTYYARAYGENSRGISYGTEISFTTLGPPKLTTTAVSNIAATTATSGGIIISDGGSPITAKGVVWSTSPNPTITLATKTDDGTGVGSFLSALSNLTSSTKYYIRAYATNTFGTAYGEDFSFTTSVLPLATLSQGLVAYYPFNGNANDESGNSNHGVVNGASLSADRFGNQNKSYLFNGINNFISTNVTGQFSEGYTLSAWIKTSYSFSTGDHKGIIWSRMTGPNGNPPNIATGLMINNGPLFTSASISTVYNVTNTQLYNDDKWHLITGTAIKTGNVFLFSLYVDGVFLSQIITVASVSSIIATSGFKIGVDDISGFGNRYWNGYIDDIRIYNRALTREEITYLANN